MKHILYDHIWGLQPFWSSDLKQSKEYAIYNELWHEISNNVVCASSKGSDQPAHTRSLIRAFVCCLNIL